MSSAVAAATSVDTDPLGTEVCSKWWRVLHWMHREAGRSDWIREGEGNDRRLKNGGVEGMLQQA